MKRLLTVLTAAVLTAAGARAGTFTNFTSSRYYSDVAFDGNIMWAATQGGLVKHDLNADTFRVYTTKDGLPDNELTGITRDGNGSLWTSAIYTDRYVRFDGSSFTTYDDAATGFIQSTYAYPVFTDTTGTVWSVAANSTPEVLAYDGTDWALYDTADGLPDGYYPKDIFAAAGSPVTVLFSEPVYSYTGTSLNFGIATRTGERFEPATTTRYAYCSGTRGISALLHTDAYGLLAGSPGALTRYADGIWRTYSTTGIPAGITHLSAGINGVVWAATEDGLYAYDGTDWTFHDLGDTVNPHLTALYSDGTGTTWAAGSYRDNKTLHSFNGTSWSRNTATGGLTIYNMVKQGSTLWLATASGVAALGGASLTLHTTADGLPSNSVGAIAVDSSGGVWCGTRSGAARYAGGTWTAYTTANGLSSNRVNAITVLPGGGVLLGTDSGIALFDGSSTFVSFVDNAVIDALGGVTALCPGENGSIYAGCDNGLARYNGVSGWSVLASTSNTDGITMSAGSGAMDASGTIWIGTALGLVSFDGSEWIWPSPGNSLPSVRVNDIMTAADGTKWCATDSGVYSGNGTSWNTYRTADGLGADKTYRIAAAPDNSIIAIHYDGFSRFNGSTWTYHPTRPDGELEQNEVRHISCAGDGSVWMGYLGLYRYNGTWSDFGDSLPYWRVNDIVTTPDGNVWATTDMGAARYSSGSWQHFAGSDGPLNDKLSVLAVDSSGHTWMGTGVVYGTERSGISVYATGTWTTYDTIGVYDIWGVKSIAVTPDGAVHCMLGVRNTNDQSSSTKLITCTDGTWTVTDDTLAGSGQLTVDGNGNLWLGADGYYSGGSWNPVTPPAGIVTSSWLSISSTCDHNGIMWFSSRNGLWGYDGTQWANYTVADGLVNNMVNDIAVDANNRKWIATTNGISILEENELGIHEFLSPEQTAALVHLSAGPNPFKSSLTISLEQLNATTPVTSLRILNQAGATVTELPVTGNTVRWNGRNVAGTEAPAGVYFAQPAQSGNGAAVRIIKTE